jgi:hypothetical protein
LLEFESLGSIDALMPGYVSAMHQTVLSEYLTAPGDYSHVFSTRELFLQDKQGYLFRVSIYLRNDMLHLDDLTYMVTLNRHESSL